jgi:hypothetical protein
VSPLLAGTRCEAGLCRTVPPRAVVESLTSEVRGRLYAQLAQAPANVYHVFPFMRPDQDEDRWGPLWGIVDEDLLERLTWHRGGQAHLTDFEVLCRAADSDAERLVVLETLSRMSATMVWLDVRSGDSLEPLTRYWSRGARTRDLRPILEAVSRVPGGGQLDLMHLLPPFARRRLNTYPRPGDPERDCFWTALNFFAVSTPPDEFLGASDSLTVLQRDYDLVPWDRRTFGDVILFVDRQGVPIHAANQVADDLVFTKNGYNVRRPWSILTLAEVRQIYPTATDLRAFHLRQLPRL